MHEQGRLLATGEQLLIHVSLKTRRACAPGAALLAKAKVIAAQHAKLPPPDGLGRGIGQKRASVS
jgi:carnitine 3-dehydrogenase